MESENSEVGVYRSGVAARLAGVPVETLRIWERRYAVVGPRLSSGRQRLYSRADIRRLTLIKRLVDMGQAIGSIASLSLAELLEMQGAMASVRSSPPGSASRGGTEIHIALVGAPLLKEQFARSVSGTTLRVVASCPDPGRAATELRDVSADAVLIDLPTLRDQDLDLLAAIKGACRTSNLIVLYRFAPSAVIRRMRSTGYAVVRATADALEIEAICSSLLDRPPPSATPAYGVFDGAEPPAPRFDEVTLVELSNASRVVECECPRHLVDLVMSLSAFERYSAECTSRNSADVALHLELQRAAGFARAVIEHALERTARAEGFPLPPQRRSGETAV